jgi:hypothetical protein
VGYLDELIPDIRFFPLDLRGDALASLEADIHTALPRMTRLTRLVWTVREQPRSPTSAS